MSEKAEQIEGIERRVEKMTKNKKISSSTKPIGFMTWLLLVNTMTVHSFTMLPTIKSNNNNMHSSSSTVFHLSSSSSSSNTEQLLDLSLEKPLGLLLEEVEEGQPKGVKVEELSEAGSAYASDYASDLVGLKVARVMDQDVTSLSFDDVMDCIIEAPSPVQISFEYDMTSSSSDNEEGLVAAVSFAIGTPVSLQVIQDSTTKTINAKVGDNLRKTLLDNNIELYKGLKKKLGNCGGGGQCTFCAVDFVEEECEGWVARSEYEDSKLNKKSSTARLACLNNIQGPATIRVE